MKKLISMAKGLFSGKSQSALRVARVSVAEDFSKDLGPALQADGPHSGEEFRRTVLQPLMADQNIDVIEVDLDGVHGYPSCFLREAFGGTAGIFGREMVMSKIRLKSDEEPLLVDEITEYISSERGSETDDKILREEDRQDVYCLLAEIARLRAVGLNSEAEDLERVIASEMARLRALERAATKLTGSVRRGVEQMQELGRSMRL